MVTSPKVLAIIPARGGSKSIPHKNLRLFAGHPLVAFSIAAGRQSEAVDRVIVSTDDEAIARAARDYGAEVPFMRPSELAQDDTLDFPVFAHALKWLAEQENYHPEVVVQLRPTSPIRPPGMVTQAVESLLAHPEADSVRGVVPSGQTPYKMWRIDDQGRLLPLLASEMVEPYNQPRQSLPRTYWQTGHIDAIRAGTLHEKHSMSGDVILPLVLDPSYTVDIDTPADWARAERLLVTGALEAVWPGRTPRRLPARVQALVLDFDGVLTDNQVWTDQEGRESVATHKGDSWGLRLLKQAGVSLFILTTETNPVVAARAAKLDIPAIQGSYDKAGSLVELLKKERLDSARVIYLGNDINDLPCFPVVGCAVAVGDAHPQVRVAADHVLTQPGGHGAIRELADWILEAHQEEETHG
jgi:YrbI family 3-deoxy-D-manno-octulosonate 8-phosphate phosphatase